MLFAPLFAILFATFADFLCDLRGSMLFKTDAGCKPIAAQINPALGPSASPLPSLK
jgi:hypothetical protein